MPAILTATLRSMTPYSSSRMHDTPRKPKEAADAYEERTWREKAHYLDNGQIFIPRQAFKFALMDAAKREPVKIKGRGQATYTAHITSSVRPPEDVLLFHPNGKPFLKSEMESVTINAHAQGRRTDSKRVKRIFPLIFPWTGTLTLLVLNTLITEDVLTTYVKGLGLSVGVGRFRAAVGGDNGLFTVEKATWKEMDL